MKSFTYRWCEDYFLLHLQLNNPNRREFSGRLLRQFSGNQSRPEEIKVPPDTLSHRIMVSRSNPGETAITIEYPANVSIEVFRIDDRAYYPTEAYFRG
jgi:hypothetical protein